jgi:hypothetical protein
VFENDFKAFVSANGHGEQLFITNRWYSEVMSFACTEAEFAQLFSRFASHFQEISKLIKATVRFFEFIDRKFKVH